MINAVAVAERHLTNMATAVNFDYRGFDTLGEEYILFAAVTGLALLLRQARGEIEDEPRPAAADREVPPPQRRGALAGPGADRGDGPVRHLRRGPRPPDARRRVPGGHHPGHRLPARLPGGRLPRVQARQPQG